MIVTDIEHLSEQAALSERLLRALDFLQTSVDRDIPDGRVEIDGTEVYALVQSYQTRPEKGRPTFEAHRKYVDVQHVVFGREILGWAPLDTVAVTNAYNDESDALLGSVPEKARTFLRFAAGQVVVLYPTDAHAPGLSDDKPSVVKKVVVKVAL